MKNKGFALVPLLISLGVVGSLAVGILGYNLKEKMNLGATIPVSNALIDTYLSIGIDNAVTSMTLANGTTRDGATLSGYNCFTIDANTPTVEYVCGTASGTSITGMTRGISMSNPNATTTPYAHRRFASVQSTDYPQIAILSRILNGTDTIPNVIKYNSEPTFTYGDHDLVTWDKAKDYTDSVAIAGAPDATTVVKGISQKATALQVASSTNIGSTGASLFIPASNATSTYNVATAPLKVVVTDNSGKIDGNFLDMSENYTFTGQNTFNATTTIAASSLINKALNLNGINYQFPSTQGASSTVLSTNGNGTLSWTPSGQHFTFATTTNIAVSGGAVATSTAFLIPSNVLTASSTIKILASVNCISGGTVDCSFKLRNSSGADLWTYTTTAVNNTRSINTDTLLIFINGLTSPNVIFMGTDAPTTAVTTIILNSDDVSTINFSTTQSLVMNIVSNAGSTATLSLFSMEIIP